MTANRGQKLMVLAALLGIAAAGVGYYTLTALAARASTASTIPLQDVVVITSDVTYGVKLEPGMLHIARYPKDAIPAGAFASLDSVVGQTTKVFMSAREPVTATKLSSRGGGLSMLVRPTMRAASIEVNQVSGVSGFVLPGDRVDVLITVDASNGSENAVTRTLLQSVEVLAAGQKTQQPDNKPITVQAVTLLVDPAGAEVLAHAQHEGVVHLVLRNPEDQEQVDVSAVSTRQMLGYADEPKAQAPRHAAPARIAAPAPTRVRIIRSADVTETPAVQDSSR